MATIRSGLFLVVVYILVTTRAFAVDFPREGTCSAKEYTDCHGIAECENDPQGNNHFRCYCPDTHVGDGYQDGTGCTPLGSACTTDNDCVSLGMLDAMPSCTFQQNGAENGTCECPDGYQWTASQTEKGCKDIDECSTNPCDANADCTNTKGAYECKCRTGDNYYGDGKTCVWKCFSDSHCSEEGAATCEVDNTCRCREYYYSPSGTNRDCVDKDECAEQPGPCPDNAKCINQRGQKAVCECPFGFYYEEDSNECKGYPKNCEEIFQNSNFMPNDYHFILPNADGQHEPAKAFCQRQTDFAITEIGSRERSPVPIPKDDSHIDFKYDVEPKDLIESSQFCSQEIRIDCTTKLQDFPVWTDIYNNIYTAWPVPSQMCPCGQMRKCNTCNCGHGVKSTDKGILINTAVKSVHFPGSGKPRGTFQIGPLRCGPKPFNLPRDCHEAKFTAPWKVQKDKGMYILPQGATNPMLVWCNMTAYSHVGITEYPVTNGEVSQTSENGEVVQYLQPSAEVAKLIEGSLFCSQRIEYYCKSSTMSAAGMRVTAGQGSSVLDFGPNGESGGCKCTKTASCVDSSVKCNCESANGDSMDMEIILDKSKMPITSVTSTVADNTFNIGPLQCAGKQFGIQPNCEKYQHEGEKQSYAFQIDPDGPSGDSDPFWAFCNISEHQGKTILNTDQTNYVDVDVGSAVVVGYPTIANPEQIADLKDRSTYCTQEVSVQCADNLDLSKIEVQAGEKTVGLDTILTSTDCTNNEELFGTVSEDLTWIPITRVTNTGTTPVRIVVRSLVCAETYKHCQAVNKNANTNGVEGENKLSRAAITIDPDGAGPGEPLAVACNGPETSIPPPQPEKPFVVLRKNGTVSQCWDIPYYDIAGNTIGSGQMGALVANSRWCRQTLQFHCGNTRLTGHISYKTCRKPSEEVWLDNMMGNVNNQSETCPCGTTSTCQGGVNHECNCESPTTFTEMKTDFAEIVETAALPICTICVTLDSEKYTSGIPSEPQKIRFFAGRLVCGKRISTFPNCQRYRMLKKWSNEVPDYTTLRFGSRDTFLAACRFFQNEEIGALSLRPIASEEEPDPDTPLDLVIQYRPSDAKQQQEAIDTNNYCTQNIYFFCTDESSLASLSIQNHETTIDSSKFTLRQLSDDEKDELCQKPAFSEKCNKCPEQNPLVLTVGDKDAIPVTKMTMDSTPSFAVDEALCFSIEKDCHDILKNNRTGESSDNGLYLIDPDQEGPVKPFSVRCRFENKIGITEVIVDPASVAGTPSRADSDGGFPFRFEVSYPGTTPEQIQSLVHNSEFCWQGVKYQCNGKVLVSEDGGNEGALVLNGQTSAGFGTGGITAEPVCACGKQETCATCNCAATGDMTLDQGYIIDKAALAVTGMKFKTDSTGAFSVTGVRCAPEPEDFPESCQEAYEWGQSVRARFIDYTKSGNFFLSPKGVEPFLVYCDFSVPENPVTIVKPKPINQDPSSEEDVEVPYGPSDEQLAALVQVSGNCYQPVRIDCFAAPFLAGGGGFSGASGVRLNSPSMLCTCGLNHECGGTESYTQQYNTECNCNLGDATPRRDSAIVTDKTALPFRKLFKKGVIGGQGTLSLTVGDMRCAPNPLEYDECSSGFNDCARQAECKKLVSGFDCYCPLGWQGISADSNSAVANGRECIDDDECSLGTPCPEISECVNTEGKYRCSCKEGFRNTDDFTCQDINECTSDSNPCDENANCYNTYGSFECLCKAGYVGDGFNCSVVTKCACFGDPHCISFDGKWNHYQGLCSYTMAKYGNCFGGEEDPHAFEVITSNWNKGDTKHNDYAYVKDVTVKVYDTTVEMKNDGTLVVNGKEVPFFTLVVDGQRKIRVVKRGRRIKLETDFALQVSTDGEDVVEVKVPESMKSKLCGLCGNYNDDASDDWALGPSCPELGGNEGDLTENEALFGSSWKSGSACEDCSKENPPRRCEQEAVVQSMCDAMLKPTDADAPFFECLQKMEESDRSEWRKSCEIDLCLAPSKNKSLCALARVMASSCRDLIPGARIRWRGTLCTEPPQCEANEEYKECGPGTEPSCDSPNVPGMTVCQPDCYCQMGYVREGDCIPVQDCGCTYGDLVMKIGDRRIIDGCSKVVHCVSHNTIDEQDFSCGEHMQCSVGEAEQDKCIPAGASDCEAVNLPYAYLENILTIDYVEDGQLVVAEDPENPFSVAFPMNGDDVTGFGSVTFKVVGGSAVVNVMATGDDREAVLELLSTQTPVQDNMVTLYFKTPEKGKGLELHVHPKTGQPSLIISKTNLCIEKAEEPVTEESTVGKCEDGAVAPSFHIIFKNNIGNVTQRSNGDYVSPENPQSKYLLAYEPIVDERSAVFKTMTVKVLGRQGAKRLTAVLISGAPENEREKHIRKNVAGKEEVTFTFSRGMPSTRVLIYVAPIKGELAPMIQIKKIEACYEPSIPTVDDKVTECTMDGYQNPGMYIHHSRNIESVDHTVLPEVITAEDKTSSFIVTYAVQNYKHATFFLVRYKLQKGSAKRVTVWLGTGDDEQRRVAIHHQLNVQEGEEMTVSFKDQVTGAFPLAKKVRFAVIPMKDREVPELQIIVIEACVKPWLQVPTQVAVCEDPAMTVPEMAIDFVDNTRDIMTSESADTVLPLDHTTRYKIGYTVVGEGEAPFAFVKFKLRGGHTDAKRVTFIVSGVNPLDSRAVKSVLGVRVDTIHTVRFDPVVRGKNLLVVVVPADGCAAPDILILEIGVCGDAVMSCPQVSLTIDYERSDEILSGVTNPMSIEPRDAFKVFYAFDAPTLKTVTFKIVGNTAKAVFIHLIGTSDARKSGKSVQKNVQPDVPVTVTFDKDKASLLKISVVPKSGHSGLIITDVTSCEEAPTTSAAPVSVTTNIAPVSVTTSTPPVSTTLGVPCGTTPCPGSNMECQDGECVCKMGYMVDCQNCVDVNECEIGEHTCVHIGQKCVNSDGGYHCECKDGYRQVDGGFCADIDECAEGSPKCGPHSECKNMLGTYDCVCCMGYSKRMEMCQSDGTKKYGGPGEECCACTGDHCNNPEPVCATDGNSYPNYRAMVETGCRKNVTLRVSYKGSCEEDCDRVKCEGMKTCIKNVVLGVGQCECQPCSEGSAEVESGAVCGSNGVFYEDLCQLNLAKCESNNQALSAASDSERCQGNGGSPQVSEWGPWSECSGRCDKGTMVRTRTAKSSTDFALRQTRVCYGTCEEGPCQPDTCTNPGQVCVAGECRCPDCTGWQDEPICGLLGDVVKTFDNECQMRKEGCETIRNFAKLQDTPCEVRSKDCSKVRYFAKLKDSDGCRSDGVEDIGLCYGGCSKFGECCQPDQPTTVDLKYTCDDGTVKVKQHLKTSKCVCLNKEQEAYNTP